MAAGVKTTYNFNTTTSFTFDSDVIGVSNSSAQLILEVASQVFNETFDTSTGFTFVTATAVFTGGSVEQLGQAPAGAIIAANYNNASLDATYANTSTASVTAIQNGSPTITSSRLDCEGNTNTGVHYEIDSLGQGAIKFKYSPNYGATPPGNINLIGIHKANNDNEGKILLTQSPSGNTIRLWINDAAGAVVESAIAIGAAPNFTTTNEYEMELNFDNVSGLTRLYIDGTLHATRTSGAWSFSAGSGYVLAIGATNEVYNKADAQYDDVIMFSAVQHTAASYTPGYSITSNDFLDSKVVLPAFTHAGAGAIKSYTGLSVTSTGTPRFTIQTDSGAEKWHDGTGWTASSATYTSANTEAQMEANLSTLTDADGASTSTINVYLPSGTTKNVVSDLTLNHTGEEDYNQSNPSIKPTSVLNANRFCSFTATSSATGSDSVKFGFEIDGTEKYYDGTGWTANSSTFTATNLASELTNSVTALASVSSSIKPVVYLHSDDGTTTPTITSMEVEYNNDLSAQSLTIVSVAGYFKDIQNNPLSSSTITVRAISFTQGQNTSFPVDGKVAEYDDSDGSWNINLIPSTIIGEPYEFTFKNGTRLYKQIRWVPSTTLNDYEDLSTTA